MERDWGKDLHLGLGKRKRNDEGTSLGVNANLDDGSCSPTLLPKHKIFLSHSGKQKWFVEKLCEDLEACHRFPFFDRRPASLPKGERFPKLILEAAEQCELAVVVVSEEYLTLKWPMIELNTFVQALSGSNPQLKILPLFLEMSMSDLKSSSRQGEWLKVWDEWAMDDARIKPVEFEKALKVMGSFNGIELNDMNEIWRYEKEVVRSICSAVVADVKWEDSHVQGCLTICKATRDKIKVIEPSEKYGICVLGYYGVGGIGKTTMCKTLCNELSEFYGKVCHIELGGSQSVEQILKDVLRKLTNTSEELMRRIDESECWNILRNCSSWRQKTFLAIDNVWDDNKSMEQAQMLLDEPAFKKGSVVMVTSRCQSTLMGLGICEPHCFEVPELEKVDAKKLLLHHAARGMQFVSDEDIWVIEQFLARCHFQKSETQGYHYLPLALKVLGMHLRRLGDSPAKWLEDLPVVRDFNCFPGDNPVFDIIRLNYDRLSEQLQALFMDVALFHPPLEWHDDPEGGFEFNYFDWLSCVHGQKLQDTVSQLQQLKERGVLEYVDIDSERVSMHDLYAEFAEMEAEGKLNNCVGFKSRRWVYSKGLYPSDLERTPSGRCWENLIRLGLKLGRQGLRAVFDLHGIQLRYCSNLVVLKLNVWGKPTGVLNLEGLRCLRSLELWASDGSDVGVEGVEDLDNLRYIRWACLCCRKLQRWSYLGKLPASLEILDLDGVNVWLRSDVFNRCRNLRRLLLYRIRVSDSIDFSQCSSLRRVCLRDMLGLQKLGLAAGLQSCLQSLEITECEDLSDVSGLGDLVPLDRLVVSLNPLLEELPDLQKLTSLRFLAIGAVNGIAEVRGLVGLRQLRELHCSRLDATELPNLSALEHLHVLSLRGCSELTTLEGVAGLTALRRINLMECESLSRLPDLSNLTKLEKLELYGSGIELHEEDIDMLAALPGLRSVDINLCTHLDPVRRKMVRTKYVDDRKVEAERDLESLPIKIRSYIIRYCSLDAWSVDGLWKNLPRSTDVRTNAPYRMMLKLSVVLVMAVHMQDRALYLREMICTWTIIWRMNNSDAKVGIYEKAHPAPDSSCFAVERVA